ncbi:MAG: DNA-deoxyinosine glycosylase [Clostridia bacterium]|nr:DNA-deoxyinosine glycosylase [Clostridia bacterium]
MPKHPFPPVYAADSRVLILGTFPSVRSRETGFYYGHKQNRFWRVMACLFEERVPVTVEEKRALLLRHGIALWDVLRECDITGSSDASIRRAVPNDIRALIEQTRIQSVYTNGKKAHELYLRYAFDSSGIEDICLPSTSPANARTDLSGLISAWQVIKPELSLEEKD